MRKKWLLEKLEDCSCVLGVWEIGNIYTFSTQKIIIKTKFSTQFLFQGPVISLITNFQMKKVKWRMQLWNNTVYHWCQYYMQKTVRIDLYWQTKLNQIIMLNKLNTTDLLESTCFYVAFTSCWDNVIKKIMQHLGKV